MPKITVKTKPEQKADSYIANLLLVLTKLDSNQLLPLYGDLFTKSEALMLAKRLEIACGLLAGKSYLQIQKQLGVTANTVAQIQKVLKSKGGGFRSAGKLLASLGESKSASALKPTLAALSTSTGPKPDEKNNFFNSVFKKVFHSPTQE